jgi:hypothetical protein
MLTEWIASTNAYNVIDGNVQSVSASQAFPDTAFIIYTNHALYEFIGSAAFTFIDNNVTTVSAGFTAAGIGEAAYYLTAAGVLVEWQPRSTGYPAGTYNFIDSNVAGMDAGFDDDTVFIIYATGQLFFHQGLTRAPSSFTFIDGNVGP